MRLCECWVEGGEGGGEGSGRDVEWRVCVGSGGGVGMLFAMAMKLTQFFYNDLLFC